MSNFCGSFGINTKFGFAPSGTGVDEDFVEATSREEILVENLNYSDSVVGGRGITGWMDSSSLKLRNGQRLVSGGLIMEIGPNQIAPWLAAIVGNTDAAIADVRTTKEKWDAVPFDLSLERDNVDHGYRYCVINRAVIRGRSNPDDQQGQIVQMALSFLGVVEEGITFPSALALAATAQYPWLLGDAALTYGGETSPLISFDITVENTLKPLFRNRLTPGCFRSLGRKITMDFAVPYGADSYDEYMTDNTADAAAVLTFAPTNLPTAVSDYSTIFTFPQTRRIAHNYSTASKDEIPLQMKVQAYVKGTSPAMTIKNVITAA